MSPRVRHPFNEPLVRHLRCPVCSLGLALDEPALRCANGHSFDVARQGYVNLAVGSALQKNADTAAQVQAREAFLAGGHYRPLAEALADCAAQALGPQVEGQLVVELGAGTGYYLARVLDRAAGSVGLALDLSKYAARRAARAHPRMGAVVADVTAALPLQSGCAAVAMSVFAPRHASEIHRVLGEGGSLLVASPGPRHLQELIAPLGLLKIEPEKQARLRSQLEPLFAPEHDVACELELRLSRSEVLSLASMGPSARHLDEAALRGRVEALEEPC
ncbi:MAG: putative RNA methyltransferase, partial [Myxococcales bacterium]